MEGDDLKDPPSLDIQLSEQAAQELVNMLVERGYFHDNVVVEEECQQPDATDDTLMKRAHKDVSLYSEMDDACLLVSSRDGQVYLTRSQLEENLFGIVQTSGRLSMSDASIDLAVDPIHVQRAAQTLVSSNNDVRLIGTELVTKQYLDEVAIDIELQLTMEDTIRVSNLAEKAGIPTEVMLQVISERLDDSIKGRLITVGGVTELVSPKFDELQNRRVMCAFSSLTTPTSVESICLEFDGWEVINNLPVLRDLCTSQKLPGELHEGSSSLGAMYIPTIYLEMQRKCIDDYFASNGYITLQKCISMGIVASKMGEYVQQSFPSAVALSGSVINQDVIVSPLQEVIQEAISGNDFVDLNMHLPEEFSNASDILEIVNTLILPNMVETSKKKRSQQMQGICVVDSGEALFFSSGMIDNIARRVMPTLVEEYGRKRAEEVENSTAEALKSVSGRSTSIGSEDDDHKSRGKKPRKRGKKASTAKKEKALTDSSLEYGVVPLTLVAKEVSSAYPDLADIQSTCSASLEENVEGAAPMWEPSGDDNGKGTGDGDGPLYEFCRVALYTSKLKQDCARAVQAELDRIQSAKQAISVSSRKDGAAKVRNMEHAFEDKSCFPSACYVVQMHAKFVEYVSGLNLEDDDSDVLPALKTEFLKGCGADFTRRITEYCLFQNEIEDGMFLFEKSVDAESNKVDNDILPWFCQPAKISVRSYPDTTFLSCSKEGQQPRAPLPVMRKLLAGNVGNVGVALARMWTLCGGETYDGGSGVSEDGMEYTRPGDYDGFLKHVEDSCLTICGIPFKKLDKKSEKQAMFSRRQELTKALQEATTGELVLDLTIMLLYQQVKGVAASGCLLSGPILLMLCREKKVPEQVSVLLKQLASCIHDKKEIDDELVESVRACGLSRDISKHDVN